MGISLYMAQQWGSEPFTDIKLFMKRMGWSMPGQAQRSSWSVLLNVSYHKEHDYIWLRD